MTAVQRLIGRCVFVGLTGVSVALVADPGNYVQAGLAGILAGMANAGFNVATPFNSQVGVAKGEKP